MASPKKPSFPALKTAPIGYAAVMNQQPEARIIPLFGAAPEAEPTAEQTLDSETWRKSIPAQVFLNYFHAIAYHLGQADDVTPLRQLPFFREAPAAPLTYEEQAEVVRLLHTGWSTEYALRATAELGDENYLRNALHWTVPQADYAIFGILEAFLHTRGIKSRNAAVVAREVGRLVVRGAYPRVVGYYAAGHYPEFAVQRLPLAAYKPGLGLAGKDIEAQAQIGQFLRTTRRLKATTVRQQVQANPNTAIRSARTGQPLDKWKPQHWQQITWRLGYTTIFDLLGRLRISATSREIERYVEAEIDYKHFHESLLTIVRYLNGLHETYVAQALGLQKYREVIATLPAHLHDTFPAERLRAVVEPSLAPQAAPAPLMRRADDTPDALPMAA